MKIVKHALMFLACSAAISSFAQTSPPQCGTANFDSNRNLFTVINPAAGAVNQQCLLTVYQSGKMPREAQQSPSSYLAEGSYNIELSGGGGGGGGGAAREAAGGSGGAGAAPLRTVQYLSPGVYKLTLGTGGEGGSAGGGQTGSGNPTSLTNARTGQLIAGFPGADSWSEHSRDANSAGGGVAQAGGSSGGSGGGTGGEPQAAQAGGMSQTAGNSGTPGQAGTERRFDNDRNAGGGGGAGVGSGGVGGSANGKSALAAGAGDLGGGGGGGRGGEHHTAQAGAQGGQGFIKLTMAGPARQAIALAPEASAQDSEITRPAPMEARPARKDRN